MRMDDLQTELSIYEVNFGYNAILEVYTNSSSHILKLYAIPQTIIKREIYYLSLKHGDHSNGSYSINKWYSYKSS